MSGLSAPWLLTHIYHVYDDVMSEESFHVDSGNVTRGMSEAPRLLPSQTAEERVVSQLCTYEA